LELQFYNPQSQSNKGRGFNCVTCPKEVQELRRCRENKWNFTSQDAAIFPIKLQEGGRLYGFCPAKSTWDMETVSIFKLMVIAVEQKTLLFDGGLVDQPAWFIDLLAWFSPEYDMQKFLMKAKMILGDSKPSKLPKGSKPSGVKRG
jgi:hypothetical protein